MADTEVQQNNKAVAFKGKPVNEKTAVDTEINIPGKPKASGGKQKGADKDMRKRAKKLLATGAISKRQHDKMVGTFAPAVPTVAAPDNPEMNMGPD